MSANFPSVGLPPLPLAAPSDDAVRGWITLAARKINDLAANADIFRGAIQVTAGGAVTASVGGVYIVNRASSSPLSFILGTRAAVYIKDAKGDCDTNPITITDAAGGTIDGDPNLILNFPFASAFLVPNAAGGWHRIA